jgi:hypothetical protein
MHHHQRSDAHLNSHHSQSSGTNFMQNVLAASAHCLEGVSEPRTILSKHLSLLLSSRFSFIRALVLRDQNGLHNTSPNHANQCDDQASDETRSESWALAFDEHVGANEIGAIAESNLESVTNGLIGPSDCVRGQPRNAEWQLQKCARGNEV